MDFRHIFKLFIPGLLIILFIGCDPDDDPQNERLVIGTGPVVTQTLSLPAFDRIMNAGVANIFVTIGETQSVDLKAQQNIIEVLTFQVIDNILEIGVEKNVTIGKAEDIRLEVIVSNLREIGVLGVGSYDLAGDYQDELEISIIGVGDVHAYDLKVGSCTIISTGVGNCWVNVTDDLRVTLAGVGNIFYKGNPEIFQDVTGMGKVINDN